MSSTSIASNATWSVSTGQPPPSATRQAQCASFALPPRPLATTLRWRSAAPLPAQPQSPSTTTAATANSNKSMNPLPRLAFSTPLLPRTAPSHRPQRCRPHRSLPKASASRVLLAPGQGAQQPDMGISWRDRSPAAAKVIETADRLLQDQLHRPLSEYIFNNTDAATLSRTDIAQPAIFVTSMACWAGITDLRILQHDQLAVTAGLSLGEYTALTVAGAISFEDALRLVTLRGRAMQDAAEASDGGMVALIGADEATANDVVQATRENDILVAANFNAPGQVVLSGASAAIDRAASYAADEKKLRVAKLDVAGAFHSPLMEPAAERLAQALESTEINLPSVPVLSNVTGAPHEMGSVRHLLVSQLTSSVRWADCCNYIRQTYPDASWTELAPGRTLTGIMRKIDRKIKVQNLAEAPVEAEA